MAEDGRQENTTRRVRVEDADYVLSSEEPNLPRVRETSSSGGFPVPVVIALCAALMALSAAIFISGSMPGTAEPPVRTATIPVTRRAGGYNTDLGLDVEDLSVPVAAYFRSKGRPAVAGVAVYSVDPEGPAAALCPGDVITEVNGKAVSTAEDLARIWAEADGAPILTVYRGGEYRQEPAGAIG